MPAYAINDPVSIPFTSKGRRVAVVVDFARDGRLKVRSWNEARKCWSSVRTINPSEMDRVHLLKCIVLVGLPNLPTN